MKYRRQHYGGEKDVSLSFSEEECRSERREKEVNVKWRRKGEMLKTEIRGRIQRKRIKNEKRT